MSREERVLKLRRWCRNYIFKWCFLKIYIYWSKHMWQWWRVFKFLLLLVYLKQFHAPLWTAVFVRSGSLSWLNELWGLHTASFFRAVIHSYFKAPLNVKTLQNIIWIWVTSSHCKKCIYTHIAFIYSEKHVGGGGVCPMNKILYFLLHVKGRGSHLPTNTF